MIQFFSFNKNIQIAVRFTIGAFLAGCLTPINIAPTLVSGHLVVSGQISPLEERSTVHLGITADSERLPFPLQGAIVQLFDDSGNSYFYDEDPENPGRYNLTGILGIPGVTYFIQITLPSGEVYKSTPEKMPEYIGEDSIFYEIKGEDYTDLEGTVTTRQFLKIYTNASLPSPQQPLYLKWSVEEVYLLSPTDFPSISGLLRPRCFITQNADPQRIVLFNGSELSTNYVSNLLVCSRPIDKTFHEKHYFITIQSSLTPEAHEYWRKVNILANQVGSIFDTPPAEITSNIYNPNNPKEKVYGYFQAVNQVYDRFVMYPEDLPFPLLLPDCTYSPQRTNYPSECYDCLIVRNSSYKRPAWF